MTEVVYCIDGLSDAECFLSIWEAADRGDIIQILGVHYIVHRQQLVSGVLEYSMRAGKFGVDGKYCSDRRGE